LEVEKGKLGNVGYKIGKEKKLTPPVKLVIGYHTWVEEDIIISTTKES